MIVTRTPLRVSFLGGGTDFPDYYNEHNGACLSAAIDKYIYVIAKRRFDNRIVLHYTKTEDVERLDDLEHDLIHECLAMAGIWSGIEITTMADIPATGTGLGSSSTLTVGTLKALYGLQGVERSPGDLAQDACEIELNMLKKGMGKQDQYAAACGGVRIYTFQKGRIDYSHFPRKVRRKLDAQLLLFFTGQTRDASEILVEQNAAIPDLLGTLGKLTKLCLRGATQLRRGDIDGFGDLIDMDWNLKKELHPRMSNEAIDLMYSKALLAGAEGGKVCGAGGGGFLLLWTPPEFQAAVREALADFQELPFKCEDRGSAVILQEGS